MDRGLLIGTWLLLLAAACGRAPQAPAAARAASPPQAAAPRDSFEARFPCARQLEVERSRLPRGAAARPVAVSEPVIALGTLRRELPSPRQAFPRDPIDIELTLDLSEQGYRPVKPDLPWPNVAIEASLPEELRSVWRAAVGMPRPGAETLAALGSAAMDYIVDCRLRQCAEDLSCYRALNAEAERSTREHAETSQTELGERLVAGLDRHPQSAALLLAAALQADLERDRYRRLIDAAVGLSKPEEPLGVYARYLAADLRAADRNEDPKQTLAAFRDVTKHARGFEALAAWFRVAMLESEAPAQEHALRSALASLAVDDRGTGAARDSAEAFLLYVLLAQRKHAERFALASRMIARGVTGEAAAAAAFHVADALDVYEPARAASLPAPAFRQVLRAYAELATERGDRVLARRALELWVRHAADDQERQTAQGMLAALEAPAADEHERVSDLAYALAQRCVRATSFGERAFHIIHAPPDPPTVALSPRAKGPFQLSVRPARTAPAVSVEPRSDAFAECLAERAPLYFALLRAPLRVSFATQFSGNFSDVSFVVLAAVRSFAAAERTAARAGRILDLSVDTRGLRPYTPGRLTLSEDECMNARLEYPCYFARGRFDDGAYLSIEASEAYDGFRPGYYLVIAASGAKRSAELTTTLARARRAGLAAYVKSSKVYTGCMH